MSGLLLKGFRKDPLSSQSGVTPKLTILIILAGSFMALVIVLPWFSLNRVQARIKADLAYIHHPSCHACEVACPVEVISEGDLYIIDGSHCPDCGRCEEVCPEDAIEAAKGEIDEIKWLNMNSKQDKECEERGDIVLLSEIITNSMYL